MAYIGAEPVPGQNREVDDISSSFNGSTTAFTLQVSGVNVSPESANNILVNLGGVLQNPDTDYTINASTLTFTTAPASGLSFFALVLGAGINTATVADGAITTSKLASDAVGANQLANTSVTAGSYTTADITVDAQGRITAAASGSISNAEIANNAVTTAKIADSTGASDGVTTAKLATDAVTAAKLADNAVVNASVDASAAIAGTKISPDFGSQNIVTTGSISGAAGTFTGDLTIPDTIVHTGDTNTKIRFPAGDVISFETAGGEALRIDSSQRISIGTTDVPGAGVQMDLRKSSDTTVYSATANQPNGLSIFNPSGVDGGFCGIQIGSTSSSGHFGSTVLKNVSVTTGYSSDFVVQTRHSGNYGERLRVRSEGGLCFNGDTAAANALDDYEEGSWTPANNGGHTAASSGQYTKIGKMVYAAFNIDISSNSDSGHATITGLPFAAENVDPNANGVAPDYQTYDVEDGPIYHIGKQQTQIVLYKNNGAALQHQNISGKNLRGTAIYRT